MSMKNVLFACAAICIFFAWLLPVHYRPWVTYTGELYAFISLMFLTAACVKDKLYLPKIGLPFLALAVLPFIQLALGHVYFFSIAFLGFLYIAAFWLAMTLGFNLCLE
jgi:hypothetical protein